MAGGACGSRNGLETTPYLIVVFRVDYGLSLSAEGQEVKTKHYYVAESVGIACGMLMAALHISGLATLTLTPSPMGFLAKILQRPNERPFLLIPVGHPAEAVTVPCIRVGSGMLCGFCSTRSRRALNGTRSRPPNGVWAFTVAPGF